jgi:hypothetical protein
MQEQGEPRRDRHQLRQDRPLPYMHMGIRRQKIKGSGAFFVPTAY